MTAPTGVRKPVTTDQLTPHPIGVITLGEQMFWFRCSSLLRELGCEFGLMTGVGLLDWRHRTTEYPPPVEWVRKDKHRTWSF